MPYPFEELFPAESIYPGLDAPSEAVDPIHTSYLSEGFLKTDLDNNWAFVRGAARLVTAPIGQEFPDDLSDILDLDTYDLVPDWEDLGATLGGITISLNHEEVIEVDQNTGLANSAPLNWSCNVSTVLAENTLEHYQLATESSVIEETEFERSMGSGLSTTYEKRRLGVLFKNTKTDLIRAFIFRKTLLNLANIEISFNKSGEQIGLGVDFKVQADFNIPELDQRFCSIIEQI